MSYKVREVSAGEMIKGICQKAKSARSKKDKIKVLHDNSSPMLKDILGLIFDPRVEFDLPPGKVEFKSSVLDFEVPGQLNYYIRNKKLNPFMKIHIEPNTNKNYLERNFIRMLETLEPIDVELIFGIKDKQMPWEGITIELVKEAFPNLSKDW